MWNAILEIDLQMEACVPFKRTSYEPDMGVLAAKI